MSERQVVPDTTVDEAIIKAGGTGRYQYFMMIVLILSMNAPGIVCYGVAYFEYDPPYLC